MNATVTGAVKSVIRRIRTAGAAACGQNQAMNPGALQNRVFSPWSK